MAPKRARWLWFGRRGAPTPPVAVLEYHMISRKDFDAHIAAEIGRAGSEPTAPEPPSDAALLWAWLRL